MPAEGGAPVRLTYNPGGAQVVAWTPDGTEVVFRSMFENVVGRDPNLYSRQRQGRRAGAPAPRPRRPHQLHPRAAQVPLLPPRQRGILLEALQGRPVPGHLALRRRGQDLHAGHGLRRQEQLPDVGRRPDVLRLRPRRTASPTSTPRSSGPRTSRRSRNTPISTSCCPTTDGRSIVYVQDGRLHVLDVASGKDAQIAVTVPSDRWALRDRVINPRDYIHTADLGDDGKTVVLEARGDVFRVPTGPGRGREPVRDARHPRDLPGPLARRQDGRLLQRQERRLPALHPAGRRRRLDADHDRPRPDRLPAGLVARRQEDPLRQQGLRDLLHRRGHEEAGQDRFLQPDEERRVHLGDRRLRLVARLQVDRLQLRPGQPQQPDLPLQHRDGEEGRGDDGLLRQSLPGLRRRRPVSLLRLEPQLRPAHGLLRGQPRHRHAPAGHGRPAPRRRGAALRRASAPGRRTRRRPRRCRSASTPRA